MTLHHGIFQALLAALLFGVSTAIATRMTNITSMDTTVRNPTPTNTFIRR